MLASTTLSIIQEVLRLAVVLAVFLLPGIIWYVRYATAYRERETAQQAALPEQPDLRAMTVAAGPLPAYYYYDWQHRPPDALPEPGMLGLLVDGTGSTLVFVGTGETGVAVRIPLAEIHYLGRASAHVYQWYSVSLYGPGADGWQIYTFGLSKQPEFLKTLAQISGLTVVASQDLGPMAAQHYRQDIYGVWWPGESWTIYLAPDRLLSNWHTAILLDHIRELTIMPVPKARWSPDLLLRIAHIEEGIGLQTVGYVLPPDQAREWGAALHQRTQVPLNVVEGRKKKESAEEG